MAAKAGRNNQRDGRVSRLEEAVMQLIQNQAAFNQTIAQQNQNHAAMLTELAELKRENTDRFARIERILLEHTRILQEHSRILENLPEAVRQKIGFKQAES
jgi:hypothetical protein